MIIGQLRLTQNSGKSWIRASDLGGGVAFLNGLDPDLDFEAQTLTTTAGSATVTLSADNALLAAGMTIVVKGGGLNKIGNPIDLAAQVTAKDGLTLTLERAVEVTLIGAQFYASPPSMMLHSSIWRFDQTYLEEIHEQALWATNRSSVLGIIKVSNGHLSGRGDCGVLLQEGCRADVSIHPKVVDAKQVKRVVGAFSGRTGTTYSSAWARVLVPAEMSFVTASDPVGIVARPAGYAWGSFPTEASGDDNPNLNLFADFADAALIYQRHGTPTKVARALRSNMEPELTAPLTIATARPIGAFSLIGSRFAKASGGTGRLIHPVAAGKTYRVTVAFSAITSMAAVLRWTNSDVDAAVEMVVARGTTPTRRVVYVTAPDSGVNGIALAASNTEVFEVTEFAVAEVL